MPATIVLHDRHLCLDDMRQNLWEETRLLLSSVTLFASPLFIIHCLLTCATSLMIAQRLCLYHASFTQSSLGWGHGGKLERLSKVLNTVQAGGKAARER